MGLERQPLLLFSAPVGGPCSPLRAEAVSLLNYLRIARTRFPDQRALLIFVDCLVLLIILMKWGKSDFQPHPHDIAHFDVLVPLLTELRTWPGSVLLVKVKSHAGCLLNERADELAERGLSSQDEQLSPGPSKYGTLWLRIRSSWRRRVQSEQIHHVVPRDNAPNKSIIKHVAEINCTRAVRKRSTQFVAHLLHRPEGSVLSRHVTRCDDAVLRVWIKAMTGIYPVQIYLHRIGKAESPQCPYCATDAIETLTHFACVCPRFREARTAAHNQLRLVVASSLKCALSDDWMLHEETPLAATGLQLLPVAMAEVLPAGVERASPLAVQDTTDLGRWQPDFILVSQEHKRIAVLELTRPSDMTSAQLEAAYNTEKVKYTPIIAALQHYSSSGWRIEVLPWVIGIRGLADPKHLHDALSFLDIPKQEWANIIEDSVLASVRALAYMHRVRHSAANAQRDSSIQPNPSTISTKRGRKRQRFASDNMGVTRQRWDNLTRNLQRTYRSGAGSSSAPSISSSHDSRVKEARERKGEG